MLPNQISPSFGTVPRHYSKLPTRLAIRSSTGPVGIPETHLAPS